jgi:transglutaminase-like putative cysteine protease
LAIRVALNHRTTYRYDRPVSLSPQIVRLRPAPHCRTPILSYSLSVHPQTHFLNWQQDPQGNYLARLVFPEKTQQLRIEVDLVAELTVINPFDFFLEPSANTYPFAYEPWLAKELAPYLEVETAGPRLTVRCYAALIFCIAWSGTGITICRCPICFPVCLSDPPARHPASMKAAMIVCTSWRLPSNRFLIVVRVRHGWWTGCFVICWLM